MFEEPYRWMEAVSTRHNYVQEKLKMGQIWVPNLRSNSDRTQIAQWTFTRTAKSSASKSEAVRIVF